MCRINSPIQARRSCISYEMKYKERLRWTPEIKQDGRQSPNKSDFFEMFPPREIYLNTNSSNKKTILFLKITEMIVS